MSNESSIPSSMKSADRVKSNSGLISDKDGQDLSFHSASSLVDEDRVGEVVDTVAVVQILPDGVFVGPEDPQDEAGRLPGQGEISPQQLGSDLLPRKSGLTNQRLRCEVRPVSSKWTRPAMTPSLSARRNPFPADLVAISPIEWICSAKRSKFRLRTSWILPASAAAARRTSPDSPFSSPPGFPVRHILAKVL